jgi:nucleoside-triphosphatase THEP1
VRGVLILTGSPRSGKTTLVERLVSEYGEGAKGFVTREVRMNGERTGFTVLRDDGTSATLADINVSHGPRVGKYRVNLRAIEETIIAFFERSEAAPFYYVDEVGKMEMAHPNFANAFRRFVRTRDGFLIVSVGLPHLRWVQSICPDAETVDLGKHTYDEGYRRARSWLSDKIRV